MRYRALGKTGLSVSELAFGGIGAMGKYGPVTAEQFDGVMIRAQECGVNLLDTAPSYGQSQRVFGHHLTRHRDAWIVCTKIGDCGPGNGQVHRPDVRHVMASVPQSLEKLRTDYIDILLVHSIEQYGQGATAAETILARGGIVDAMRSLQRDGRVRYIGVSGHVTELVHAVRTGEFDVALTYNSFNLLVQDAQTELFPTAQENGVGILLGGALYQGLLAGLVQFLIDRKESFFEQNDPAYYRTDELVGKAERLLTHFDGDGRALRQAAIQFSLSHTAVSAILSAMFRIEHVEENASACISRLLPDSQATLLLEL